MTEQTSQELNIDPALQEQLKEQSVELQKLVEAGDYNSAMAIVNQLAKTQENDLFNEVGQLTRTLYESIRNFQIDSELPENVESISRMNDASDRLTYVVEMTNKAANKTLDLVEETMPYASEINNEAKQLKAEWERLQRKEMKPDEFRALSGRMDGFLGRLSVDAEKVNSNLSEILLAQDFQDLTGQVIQKVTGLVKEVEENLVSLVRMAGKVDEITGTVHDLEQKEENISEGHGPQMNAEKRDDVVSGQDDVDDLLSSLGF